MGSWFRSIPLLEKAATPGTKTWCRTRREKPRLLKTMIGSPRQFCHCSNKEVGVNLRVKSAPDQRLTPELTPRCPFLRLLSLFAWTLRRTDPPNFSMSKPLRGKGRKAAFDIGKITLLRTSKRRLPGPEGLPTAGTS